MIPNQKYKRLYLKDYAGIYWERSRVVREAEGELAHLMQAEQKRRQPKARTKFKPLEQEVIDAMKAPLFAKWKPIVDELDKLYKDARDSRQERLEKMADDSEVMPEYDPLNWYVVDTSDSGSYSSQGYGHTKYAKGSLMATHDALERHGFIVRIVERVHSEHWQTFELQANCPKWMAHALGVYSMLDFIKSCDRADCNPRVLMPFMSYDAEEKCRSLIAQDNNGHRYAS